MYLALNEYCIGFTNKGYNNSISAAQASDHQLSVTRSTSTNTGTITISLMIFKRVFSGTVIRIEAFSNIDMRCVTDFEANPGIFFVEVYIFKGTGSLNSNLMFTMSILQREAKKTNEDIK